MAAVMPSVPAAVAARPQQGIAGTQHPEPDSLPAQFRSQAGNAVPGCSSPQLCLGQEVPVLTLSAPP